MRSVWHALGRPWLALLLRQTVLCRALVGAVAVLALAHVMGFSLFPCYFATITGLPCPGCGMTRATIAFLKGDIRLALAYHPFVPGFLLLGGLMAFCAIAPEKWREAVIRWVSLIEVHTRIPTIFLLAVLIYGLLRMGGICSSAAEVKPSPVRSWLQQRAGSGNTSS